MLKIQVMHLHQQAFREQWSTLFYKLMHQKDHDKKNTSENVHVCLGEKPKAGSHKEGVTLNQYMKINATFSLFFFIIIIHETELQ